MTISACDRRTKWHLTDPAVVAEDSHRHREMQEASTSTGCCNGLCSQVLLLQHLPSKIRLQIRYWITVRISPLALPRRKPSCNASHIYMYASTGWSVEVCWRSVPDCRQFPFPSTQRPSRRTSDLRRLLAAAHTLPSRYVNQPHHKIKDISEV